MIFLIVAAVGLIVSLDNDRKADSGATQSPESYAVTQQSDRNTNAVSSYASAPTASVWNLYSPDLRYFYNQLSYTEKCAFSAQYDAIALGRADLYNISGFQLDSRQRYRIDLVFSYDCPELLQSPMDSIISEYSTEFFRSHPGKMNRELEQIKAVVSRIRSRNDYGNSAFQKQLAYDGYIKQHCSYRDAEFSGDTDVRTAYASLVNGSAICSGYAKGTELALRMLGVPCIFVDGTAQNSTAKGAHAWNMVQIDGQWYQYDSMWNDPDRDYSDYYPYFNLTDDRMFSNHQIKNNLNEYGFSLPGCTATANNYYQRKGRYLGANWAGDIPSILKSASRNGEREVSVMFSGRASYNSAVQAIKSGNLRTDVRYSYFAKEDALMIYFILK